MFITYYLAVINVFLKIFKIVRRITVSFFLLYAYNMFSQSINLIIPINIVTVLSISILGIPALLSFIVMSIFIFQELILDV